jgi:hypothetical protein
MEYAALAAVHRIKPERRPGVLDLFRGGTGADPQFFDAQRAVIVRIEGNARMIVGVETQNLLRDQFQSKQEFRAIFQQEVDVAASELDDEVRIFKVRVTVVARFDREVQLELAVGYDLTKKPLDPGTSLMN